MKSKNEVIYLIMSIMYFILGLLSSILIFYYKLPTQETPGIVLTVILFIIFLYNIYIYYNPLYEIIPKISYILINLLPLIITLSLIIYQGRPKGNVYLLANIKDHLIISSPIWFVVIILLVIYIKNQIKDIE